ncbi:ERI1 exoribonuclease 3 [Protopterus annectens]|uniref:ERI1 exoribonuclease 3 n=1 Tax=Protopterus annectens TaxID=7888 RepID=UPI001CF97C45|nr:ERI1 exoribonuclease 3 [Protopterus annectens]
MCGLTFSTRSRILLQRFLQLSSISLSPSLLLRCGVNTRSKITALSKPNSSRLCAFMATSGAFTRQQYDYFLVLDFEATCEEKKHLHPQEIIEFPILKINGRTMEEDSRFHTYVQPVYHPHLTPFCTKLTGIIQEMVEGQPTLQHALQMVDDWMKKEDLLNPDVRSVFVTCGDWDLKTMLPGQCEYLGLQVPDYFKQWINLKKVYASTTGIWPRKNDLISMIHGLQLKHVGRHHSGIDDCLNIASIMRELVRRGVVLERTYPSL